MINEIRKTIIDKFYAFPEATEKEIEEARKKGIPDFIIEFYKSFNGCFIGFEEKGQIAPDGKEYRAQNFNLV